MADITFARSMTILFEAMIASLQEILRLSDAQLDDLLIDFESRLPEYLKNALHTGQDAA